VKKFLRMLAFSPHVERHKNDISAYLKKLNCNVDPFSEEILYFLERIRGIPQIPNQRLGETERWRIILHFQCCAKIRYVIARRGDELILVTAHPDPDAEKCVEIT